MNRELKEAVVYVVPKIRQEKCIPGDCYITVFGLHLKKAFSLN